MKYFDTKKDSLEEAISKAINEKPEQLKEARYEIKFDSGEFGQDDEDDYADMLQGELEGKRIRVKVGPGSKNNTLSFDTNVPKAKLKKVIEDDLGYYVNESSEYYSNPNAKDLLEAGGKYLKYSDLLLQKGRLMAKNQSTAMIDKEIKKEMQKLGIKEETGDKDKYKEFFQSALKKFGVDSPADFKDDAKKKEFFNYVDKNYKGDHEESVDLEEEDVKIIMDKDVSNRDFQKLMKKFKLKVKETGEYNQGYAEVEISGDKRDMEKMMKVTRDSLSNYKFNSRTKTYESNNLKEYIQADGSRRKVKEGDQRRKENKLNEKDLDKNVDETLDRIREANVQKGRTMRNILADIWKMNEGKSPFEKVKKEEDEDKKSSKTMTGQKPTKVEIEPEVK
jgi:hypothetical protein